MTGAVWRVGEFRRLVVIAAALFVLALALMWPAFVWGPVGDVSSFMVVAGRWWDGGWPYLATFDNKPPLFYVLLMPVHLLGQVIGYGPAIAITWAAIAAILGLIIRELLSRAGLASRAAVSGAIVAVAVCSSSFLGEGGGYAEVPALALLSAGLLVASRSGAHYLRGAVVAGLLVSCACLVSLVVIPFAPIVPAFLLLSRRTGPRLMFNSALLFIIGLAAPLILVIGAFAAAGALPAAINAVIDYNEAYTKVRVCSLIQDRGWPCGYTPILNLWAIPPFALPAMLVALYGAPRWRARPLLAAAGVACVLIFVVIVLSSQRLVPHYALVLALPAGLLTGFGFEQAIIDLRQPRHPVRIRAELTVLGLLMAAFFLIPSVVFPTLVIPAANRDPALGQVADYLRQEYQGRPYWVWDPYSQAIYLLAPAPAVDPSIDLYGLWAPGFTTPAMGETLACSIARRRALIVTGPAMIEGRGLGLHPTPAQRAVYDLADVLDPVRHLADGYHLVKNFSRYSIYAPDPDLSPYMPTSCPV